MTSLQQRAEAAEAERAKAPSAQNAIEAYRGNIAAALPPGFPGGIDRFVRIARTAISSNPKLAGCTPRSIVGAVIQAGQLGLTPNLMGQCWILPYADKRKGIVEAQFQLGWKGLVELAGRAGIRIDAQTVHRNDTFSYGYGLNPHLDHRPAFDDRGDSFLWYAVAHFPDGSPPKFAVVDRAHVDRRRAASKSPNSPAWVDWYDEMALGKAVRELCRTLVLSVELQRALDVDDRIIDVGEVIDLEPVDDDGQDDIVEATIVEPTPAAPPAAAPDDVTPEQRAAEAARLAELEAKAAAADAGEWITDDEIAAQQADPSAPTATAPPENPEGAGPDSPTPSTTRPRKDRS